jgi:hypothetical protein
MLSPGPYLQPVALARGQCHFESEQPIAAGDREGVRLGGR